MKRLDVVITDLTDAARETHPNLARLLARGRAGTDAADPSASAALARLCGLDVAELAPIALAAEGIDPGEARWFRADPVHLLAGMHSLSLFDSRHFALRADEAADLVATLNSHFAGEIEFLAPHPRRWYARFARPLAFAAPPLDEVAGGHVVPGLVTGPDAAVLHGLAMEAQMLLHGHPVNAAREAADEPIVNGIWFWGGGRRRRPEPAYARIVGGDHMASAVAAAAGIPWIAAAEFTGLDSLPDATLAVLSIAADDAALDAGLFGPLLGALQRGRLGEATLSVVGPDGMRLRLTPWRAWAFWRR